MDMGADQHGRSGRRRNARKHALHEQIDCTRHDLSGSAATIEVDHIDFVRREAERRRGKAIQESLSGDHRECGNGRTKQQLGCRRSQDDLASGILSPHHLGEKVIRKANRERVILTGFVPFDHHLTGFRILSETSMARCRSISCSAITMPKAASSRVAS